MNRDDLGAGGEAVAAAQETSAGCGNQPLLFRRTLFPFSGNDDYGEAGQASAIESLPPLVFKTLLGPATGARDPAWRDELGAEGEAAVAEQ